MVAQLAARPRGIAVDTYQYSRLPTMAGDPLPPHEFRSRCMRGWREDVGKTINSPGLIDFRTLMDRAREYGSTKRFHLSGVTPAQRVEHAGESLGKRTSRWQRRSRKRFRGKSSAPPVVSTLTG